MRCGSWSGAAWSPTTPSLPCARTSAAPPRAPAVAPARARAAAPPARTAPAGCAHRTSSPSGPPSAGGRWSLLPLAEGTAPDSNATVRAKAMGELLLERHGVVTRGAVVSEGIRGGFALAYKVLSGFEETGRARRGYFIDGLGAAQFATGATVDRLRGYVIDPEAEPKLEALTLAATDPANAYGAALPWPRGIERATAPAARPARSSRMVDGRLVLYIERGGKSVLTFTRRSGGAAGRGILGRGERAVAPRPDARREDRRRVRHRHAARPRARRGGLRRDTAGPEAPRMTPGLARLSPCPRSPRCQSTRRRDRRDARRPRARAAHDRLGVRG